MEPKEEMKKMKSPEDKNPSGSDLELSVIKKFIDQQYKLLKFLELALSIDISKTKTSIRHG